MFPVVDNGCGYSDGVTKRSGLAAALFAAVSAVSLVAGCSEDNGPAQPGGGGAPTDAAQAKHGPFFPECGGISDQTVAQLTQVVGPAVGGLLIAGFMGIIGKIAWWKSLLTAFIFVAIMFVTFDVAFDVIMPKGPLEAAFGR